MFKALNTKKNLALGMIFASTMSAMAAPVTVDLSDAETSLTNAGTAMIGVAVVALGLILVIRFLRKG